MRCTCTNDKCNKSFIADPDVICPHCNVKQKMKKSAITAVIITAAIGTVGYNINNWVSDNRYPMHVEYSLINRCINDDQRISTQDYKRKFNICVAALDKTIQDVNYSTYKSDRTKFNSTFNKHLLR